MRKLASSTQITILISSLITGVIITLLLVMPGTVSGMNVTLGQANGEGSSYPLGRTILFQGQVQLGPGEFQDIQNVEFQLFGPHNEFVALPMQPGTYNETAQLSAGQVNVSVGWQNVTFDPFGYGQGFVGGPSGGSLLYNISYMPPANMPDRIGAYHGQLSVFTPGNPPSDSPLSPFYLSAPPPPTPTPTPPGTPVIIEPPPTGSGSVFEPGTPTQLNTPSGGSALDIPAGFLDEPAQVVLEELDTQDVPPPPAGMRVLRAVSINVYDLQGNHQTVVTGVPVTLTIGYTDEDVAAVGGDPSKLVVMRFVESQNRWVTLQTSVDTQRKVLIAKLNTFSTFAVSSNVTLGDINADGVVNYLDLAVFAASYGSQQGDSSYLRTADLNADGKVDHLDLGIFATNYGSGR